MLWEKQYSDTKPEPVDDTSSNKYVYVTRNVVETEDEDRTGYEYEECKIPKELYPFVKDNIIN